MQTRPDALTFLVVDTSSYYATRQLLALSERPEVEELRTVAGDGSLLIKVRADVTKSLVALLMEIQSLEGVRSVRSYIALPRFLERAPRLADAERDTSEMIDPLKVEPSQVSKWRARLWKSWLLGRGL